MMFPRFPVPRFQSPISTYKTRSVDVVGEGAFRDQGLQMYDGMVHISSAKYRPWAFLRMTYAGDVWISVQSREAEISSALASHSYDIFIALLHVRQITQMHEL